MTDPQSAASPTRIVTGEDLVKRAQARVKAAQEKARDVAARVSEGQTTVTGRDQVATVGVSAAGSLTSLTLSDRARNLTPVQLSQSIMSTYRDAAREAAKHTLTVIEEETGNAEVVAITRASMPAFVFSDDDEDDQDTGR
jgi:hypothetical protein